MFHKLSGVTVVVLLGCCLAMARMAIAGTVPDDGLDQLAKACDQKMDVLKTKIERVVLWSSILTMAGAIVAGTGSALAGFLGKEGKRRAAAVVGALGAVLSISPKVLPDQDELHKGAAAADSHRVLGKKVRAQLQYARADESITVAKKYAAARFVDCAALESSDEVPELPQATASNTPTNGREEAIVAAKGPDEIPKKEIHLEKAARGPEPPANSMGSVPRSYTIQPKPAAGR